MMIMMNVFQMIHVQMLHIQVGQVMVGAIALTTQMAAGMAVTVVNLLV